MAPASEAQDDSAEPLGTSLDSRRPAMPLSAPEDQYAATAAWPLDTSAAPSSPDRSAGSVPFPNEAEGDEAEEGDEPREPLLGSTSRRSIGSNAPGGWVPQAVGEPGELDFSLVLLDAGGRRVSPWHTVPLHSDQGTFNMVCTTPKGSQVDCEVAVDTLLAPLVTRTCNGVPARFAGPSPWNYGCLPQTWASSGTKCTELGGLPFDDSPVEVVDIGAQVRSIGEVYAVEPLVAFAIVDPKGFQVSWKVVGIASDDPSGFQDISDETIAATVSTLLDCIKDWLCTGRQWGGERNRVLALNEGPAKQDKVLELVASAHAAWQLLKAEMELGEHLSGGAGEGEEGDEWASGAANGFAGPSGPEDMLASLRPVRSVTSPAWGHSAVRIFAQSYAAEQAKRDQGWMLNREELKSIVAAPVFGTSLLAESWGDDIDEGLEELEERPSESDARRDIGSSVQARYQKGGGGGGLGSFMEKGGPKEEGQSQAARLKSKEKEERRAGRSGPGLLAKLGKSGPPAAVGKGSIHSRPSLFHADKERMGGDAVAPDQYGGSSTPTRDTGPSRAQSGTGWRHQLPPAGEHGASGSSKEPLRKGLSGEGASWHEALALGPDQRSAARGQEFPGDGRKGSSSAADARSKPSHRRHSSLSIRLPSLVVGSGGSGDLKLVVAAAGVGDGVQPSGPEVPRSQSSLGDPPLATGRGRHSRTLSSPGIPEFLQAVSRTISKTSSKYSPEGARSARFSPGQAQGTPQVLSPTAEPLPAPLTADGLFPARHVYAQASDDEDEEEEETPPVGRSHSQKSASGDRLVALASGEGSSKWGRRPAPPSGERSRMASRKRQPGVGLPAMSAPVLCGSESCPGCSHCSRGKGFKGRKGPPWALKPKGPEARSAGLRGGPDGASKHSTNTDHDRQASNDSPRGASGSSSLRSVFAFPKTSSIPEATSPSTRGARSSKATSAMSSKSGASTPRMSAPSTPGKSTPPTPSAKSGSATAGQSAAQTLVGLLKGQWPGRSTSLPEEGRSEGAGQLGDAAGRGEKKGRHRRHKTSSSSWFAALGHGEGAAEGSGAASSRRGMLTPTKKGPLVERSSTECHAPEGALSGVPSAGSVLKRHSTPPPGQPPAGEKATSPVGEKGHRRGSSEDNTGAAEGPVPPPDTNLSRVMLPGSSPTLQQGIVPVRSSTANTPQRHSGAIGSLFGAVAKSSPSMVAGSQDAVAEARSMEGFSSGWGTPFLPSVVEGPTPTPSFKASSSGLDWKDWKLPRNDTAGGASPLAESAFGGQIGRAGLGSPDLRAATAGTGIAASSGPGTSGEGFSHTTAWGSAASTGTQDASADPAGASQPKKAPLPKSPLSRLALRSPSPPSSLGAPQRTGAVLSGQLSDPTQAIGARGTAPALPLVSAWPAGRPPVDLKLPGREGSLPARSSSPLGGSPTDGEGHGLPAPAPALPWERSALGARDFVAGPSAEPSDSLADPEAHGAAGGSATGGSTARDRTGDASHPADGPHTRGGGARQLPFLAHHRGLSRGGQGFALELHDDSGSDDGAAARDKRERAGPASRRWGQGQAGSVPSPTGNKDSLAGTGHWPFWNPGAAGPAPWAGTQAVHEGLLGAASSASAAGGIQRTGSSGVQGAASGPWRDSSEAGEALGAGGGEGLGSSLWPYGAADEGQGGDRPRTAPHTPRGDGEALSGLQAAVDDGTGVPWANQERAHWEQEGPTAPWARSSAAAAFASQRPFGSVSYRPDEHDADGGTPGEYLGAGQRSPGRVAPWGGQASISVPWNVEPADSSSLQRQTGPGSGDSGYARGRPVPVGMGRGRGADVYSVEEENGGPQHHAVRYAAGALTLDEPTASQHGPPGAPPLQTDDGRFMFRVSHSLDEPSPQQHGISWEDGGVGKGGVGVSPSQMERKDLNGERAPSNYPASRSNDESHSSDVFASISSSYVRRASDSAREIKAIRDLSLGRESESTSSAQGDPAFPGTNSIDEPPSWLGDTFPTFREKAWGGEGELHEKDGADDSTLLRGEAEFGFDGGGRQVQPSAIYTDDSRNDSFSGFGSFIAGQSAIHARIAEAPQGNDGASAQEIGAKSNGAVSSERTPTTEYSDDSEYEYEDVDIEVVYDSEGDDGNI